MKAAAIKPQESLPQASSGSPLLSTFTDSLRALHMVLADAFGGLLKYDGGSFEP